MTLPTLVFAAGALFGLAARCRYAASGSLWFDEGYTWRLALRPTIEILDRLRFDSSPPLHFLLSRYWMLTLGEAPEVLRALSVAAGLATVIGVYLFTGALVSGSLAGPGVTRREVTWAPALAAT